MLSEKENFLKTIRGDTPEWIPMYRDAAQWVLPSFLVDHLEKDIKVDIFGVEWVVDDKGPMPNPHKITMKEVSRWREYVNLPDLDSLDWEAQVKKDTAMCVPGKANVCNISIYGIFLVLMNMMGFEGGLCALYEEPDEVKEFYEELTQFFEKIERNLIKYYNPDVIMFGDDLASFKGPFISMDMFKEMFKPYYKRLIDISAGAGIPVEFHCCGKCEKIIEELTDLGITIWEPAEPVNDLHALRKKYGRNLVFNGGWFRQGPGGLPGASEEVVRKSVRDAMDAYAYDGAYIFWDGDVVGTSDDMKQKIAWVRNEGAKYAKNFYK